MIFGVVADGFGVFGLSVAYWYGWIPAFAGMAAGLIIEYFAWHCYSRAQWYKVVMQKIHLISFEKCPFVHEALEAQSIEALYPYFKGKNSCLQLLWPSRE